MGIIATISALLQLAPAVLSTVRQVMQIIRESKDPHQTAKDIRTHVKDFPGSAADSCAMGGVGCPPQIK